jgi:pyroglutamyl-peptidase
MKTRQPQAKKSKELNASKPSRGLSCLIAGFDPFGDHSANPSGSVAHLMSEQFVIKGKRIAITSVVLPSQGQKAWLLLKEVVAKLPAKDKRVIILLGLAGDRKVISIERFALNIRDYRIKDNDGNMFVGEKIFKNAPAATRTKAPIEAALNRLDKHGLPAAISNYAGTFVCNETYFRALHYLQNSKPPCLVSFIHLPLPRAYGMTLKKMGGKKYKHLAGSKEKQLIAMSKAIKIIAQSYCEYMAKRK